MWVAASAASHSGVLSDIALRSWRRIDRLHTSWASSASFLKVTPSNNPLLFGLGFDRSPAQRGLIFSEGIFKFSICRWFSRNFSPIFVVALLCKSRRIRKYEWSFRIHFNPLSLPNKRRLACAVECTIYSILCIVILFMGPIFGLGLHSTDQNPCIIRYKSTNWTVKGVHIINLFKIKSDSKWHILAL